MDAVEEPRRAGSQQNVTGPRPVACGPSRSFYGTLGLRCDVKLGGWVCAMKPDIAASLCGRSVWLVAPCVALLGCNQVPAAPVACGYVLNLALLSPALARLNIGDTLTMHRTWDRGVARQCLPADTGAAGVRWWEGTGVVAIDSITGHLTALRPGSAVITLSPVGLPDAALGQAGVGVLEPSSADSVVTIVRNVTGASAWVVVADANATVQRSQTVGARDSTCWVTPLSDSVRYTVTIRPPPPPVPLPGDSDSTMVRWVPPSALDLNHTWRILVDSTVVQSVRTISVTLFALPPDPGTGCSPTSSMTSSAPLRVPPAPPRRRQGGGKRSSSSG